MYSMLTSTLHISKLFPSDNDYATSFNLLPLQLFPSDNDYAASFNLLPLQLFPQTMIMLLSLTYYLFNYFLRQ